MYPKRSGNRKMTSFFPSRKKLAYKFKSPSRKFKKQYKRTNRSFFKPSYKRLSSSYKLKAFNKTRIVTETVSTDAIQGLGVFGVWQRYNVLDMLRTEQFKLLVSRYEEFTISSVTIRNVCSNIHLTTGHLSAEFRNEQENSLNRVKFSEDRPRQMSFFGTVLGSIGRTENIKRKLNCTATRTNNRMSTWVKSSEYLNTNASDSSKTLIPEDLLFRYTKATIEAPMAFSYIISYKVLLKNPLNSTNLARSMNYDYLQSVLSVPINGTNFITEQDVQTLRDEQFFRGANTMTDTEREELMRFTRNPSTRSIFERIRDTLDPTARNVIGIIIDRGIANLASAALRQAYNSIRGQPELNDILRIAN